MARTTKNALLEKIKENIEELKKDKRFDVTFEDLRTRVKVKIALSDDLIKEIYNRYKKAYRSKSKSKKYYEQALTYKINFFRKDVDTFNYLEATFNKNLKDLKKLLDALNNTSKEEIFQELYKKEEERIKELVEKEYNEWIERKESYKLCKEFREALKNKDAKKIEELIKYWDTWKAIRNIIKKEVIRILSEKKDIYKWDMIAILDAKNKYVLALYVDKNRYEYDKNAWKIWIKDKSYEVYLIDLIEEKVIDVTETAEKMLENKFDLYGIYLDNFYELSIEKVTIKAF